MGRFLGDLQRLLGDFECLRADFEFLLGDFEFLLGDLRFFSGTSNFFSGTSGVSVRIMGAQLERTSFWRVEICFVFEVTWNVEANGAGEYCGQQHVGLHLKKTKVEEYGTAKGGDQQEKSKQLFQNDVLLLYTCNHFLLDTHCYLKKTISSLFERKITLS